MSLSSKILELLDRGVRPDTIRKDHPWLSLPAEDRETLFSEAERRIGDPTGYDLLVTLYMMTRKADLWDALQVLALLIRRPDIEIKKKQNILSEMRSHLDQIRDGLSKAPREVPKTRRYRQYEADYYALNAQVLVESGRVDRALQSYQTALTIYRKLCRGDGDFQSQMDRLRPEQTQFEAVRTEHGKLTSKLKTLRLEIANEEQQLVSLQVKREQLETQVAEGELRADELRNRLKLLESEIQERQRTAIAELSARRDKTRIQIEQLEREQEQLKSSVSALRKEHTELESSTQDLQQQRTDLETAIAMLIEQQAELVKHQKELEQEIAGRQREKVDMDKTGPSRKSKVAGLEGDLPEFILGGSGQ